MLVVTGGMGFIGSNLVHALNARGRKDLLVVDDLTDGTKFRNVVSADLAGYLDKSRFLDLVRAGDGSLATIEAIFHQGACSSTTEWDGRMMMDTNYAYSRALLDFATARGIPFIYASSASVYGGGNVFREERRFEAPLNVYGYSKFLFDEHVRGLGKTSHQVVGLRYFNVYGPREAHKGPMASVAFQLHGQLRDTGRIKLFRGVDGYGDGEQRRDFVHVDDVVAANLWFLDHPSKSGVFNCGTGKSQSFNDVAHAVLRHHGRGEIEYVAFPETLRGRYQSFTEADVTRLREAGCDVPFRRVEEGVASYLRWLDSGAP